VNQEIRCPYDNKMLLTALEGKAITLCRACRRRLYFEFKDGVLSHAVIDMAKTPV
jgi:hypothetical protein